MLNSLLQHTRRLERRLGELVIPAASVEHTQIGFLEGLHSVIRAADGRRQCDDRRTPAMRVIEAVDQVHVPRTRTAGATSQPAEHAFGHCRVGPSLFVANVNPLNAPVPAQSVVQEVEAVTRDAVESLDPGFCQHIDDGFGDRPRHCPSKY